MEESTQLSSKDEVTLESRRFSVKPVIAIGSV